MPNVLILGASRGLGLGLAEEFAARGWNVIATAREPAKADKLYALTMRTQGQVRVEKADIDKTEDIEALHERLKGITLDVLYVNAGVGGDKSRGPRSWTRDDVADVMMTNVFRTIGAAQIFEDRVKPGTGIIAFMSSRVGSVAFVRNRPEGDDLYRASKAALNAITRSFQMRMKDQSVTVLSISPGLVKTDLTGGRGEIDVPTACKGVVDLVLKAAGTQKHGFFRYDGEELPW